MEIWRRKCNIFIFTILTKNDKMVKEMQYH